MSVAATKLSGAEGVRRKRWTRKEYERLADLDLFRSGPRVELIDGEIVEMSPHSSQHATAILAVQDALQKIFGDAYHVRVQLPLALGERDEPEPDVSVVKGAFREYADHHPALAVLVVEVADTSLPFDRSLKLQAYARAGIQEYWIVNLQSHTVEVHREPERDTYREKLTCQKNESIATLEMAEANIAVKDLLP